jgi:hypothetical protein
MSGPKVDKNVVTTKSDEKEMPEWGGEERGRRERERERERER